MAKKASIDTKWTVIGGIIVAIITTLGILYGNGFFDEDKQTEQVHPKNKKEEKFW